MSKIRERFALSKQLIPYVMAGFPDIEGSKRIINALIDAGCSIIEIGIPYSDPLADGPTIQRASEAALAAGTDTLDVFDLIKEVKSEKDFSPVLMVYYNLIYRFGPARFAETAADSGVEGVIVPDLSVEDADDWLKAARGIGLDTVFLVAPTSSTERVARIAGTSSGFIYCVSLTGVTGARAALPENLVDFVNRVRQTADLPLAVGFGISKPEQAKEIAAVADGVIVGSAFIDLIERESSIESASSAVAGLASELAAALHRRPNGY